MVFDMLFTHDPCVMAHLKGPLRLDEKMALGRHHDHWVLGAGPKFVSIHPGLRTLRSAVDAS